ncbi:MAG: hypothetical protein LBD13_04770 [Spirochaetaceae bacterium]|jgi:hypothetical protein|nr:hypothetical protein [Spirochaetaceae bacterium]
MIFDKESVILSDNVSFESVLDKTCERLWGKKIQYSIRRIRELETTLQGLEQELDTLCQKSTTDPPYPDQTERGGTE